MLKKPGSQAKFGNNESENDQVNEIATGLGLTKEERERLHDEISGQGLNFNQVLELAQDILTEREQ